MVARGTTVNIVTKKAMIPIKIQIERFNGVKNVNKPPVPMPPMSP